MIARDCTRCGPRLCSRRPRAIHMARSLMSTYRLPGAAQLLIINHSLFITNSSSGAARLGCEHHDRPRRLVLGRPLCRPPLSPPSALTSHTHTRVHASLEEHRLPLGPLVDPQDRRRPQICLDAQHVFMPNTREDTSSAAFGRIPPYSAVFTVFAPLVFTRCSEFAAQDRPPALTSAYSAPRPSSPTDCLITV